MIRKFLSKSQGRARMKVDLELICQNFSNVEFFLVCIFPSEPPEFYGSANDLLVLNSTKFWAVTSRSPASRAGLAHKIAESFVVFRGYEASVGTHSYSPISDLAQIVESENLENGVFSFLRFDTVSQTATIKNDAFGMNPMYFREKNGTWFFASHPGLIHFSGDLPNLTNWSSLMQNGYAMGDHSFYDEIKRFSAGTEVRISEGLCETEQWFDFNKLPVGGESVDDEAVNVIENVFRAVMLRCLKLKVGDVTLPFSSGFDSRRFFALLVKNKVSFKAVTCQSFARKRGRDYDVDSVYAPKIAAAFGVDCEVIAASSGEQLVADLVKRQRLIGTETFMHSWAMPLMRWLSGRPPSLILDGLAGDVFGNSSFDIEGLDGNPNRSAAEIVEKAVKPGTLKHLSDFINSSSDYRKKYRQYVDQFPQNINQSQLAFLQSRTRRSVAPWISMMHPPGHVAVFPYLDLEFVRAVLAYDPGQKYQRYLQRECLQRFYPEFYDFAGSRKLPPDHVPIDEKITFARQRAQEEYTFQDWFVVWTACQYLSFQNKILLLVSTVVPKLRERRGWLFRPLLGLLRTQREAVAYMNVCVPMQSKKTKSN
jgi:asparagine synthetase B (glutamine-hydrolysing)